MVPEYSQSVWLVSLRASSDGCECLLHLLVEDAVISKGHHIAIVVGQYRALVSVSESLHQLFCNLTIQIHQILHVVKS